MINKMPFAHVIQWGAMLAIDRGYSLVYNREVLDRIERQEIEEILNA